MISDLFFITILVATLYLGILVYNKDKIKQENKFFVIFIFWIIMWLISNYLENFKSLYGLRELFLKIDFIIGPIFSYYWYLFCYVFLEDKIITKKHNLSLISLCLLTVFLVLTNRVIGDIHYSGDVIKFNEKLFYSFYGVVIFYYQIGGVYFLFSKFLRFLGKKKLQTLYILIGFYLSSVIGITTNLLLQNVLSLFWFRMSSFSIVFIVFFTSYAIIKHDMYDIRKFVQRGIVYIFSLMSILAMYIFILLAIGYFSYLNNVNVTIVAGIFLVLGIYSLPAIEKYFKKITDHFFFKNKINYSSALYNLSQVLNTNIELPELLVNVVKTLKSVLKVEDVKVYLLEGNFIIGEDGVFKKSKECLTVDDIDIITKYNLDICFPDKILKNIQEKVDSDKVNRLALLLKKCSEKYNAKIFVKVKLQDKIKAIIIIGEKKSGDYFDDDDINILKTFSYQAGVSIEKAVLYDKIRKYSENLEVEVEKRTSKIKNLQLEQKQMMVDMAHGLQTPLTILKGELDLIKNKTKKNENIFRMEKSVDKLSKFIYDMLSLARIENIDKSIALKKINFSELLNDLIEYFEVVLEENGIKIIHDIEKEIYILGDKEKLEEMVINIVSNSKKYMKDVAEKNITIILKKDEKNVSLTLGDNGLGMSKEDLKNVFKRFYRSKDVNQSRIHGTGLGLTISKKIVEMHNGNISVESKLGIGTKFLIKFNSDFS